MKFNDILPLIILLVGFSLMSIVYNFNEIKQWVKIKYCIFTNHKKGAFQLIERTPLGDWLESENCSRAVRVVNEKYKCECCGNVFIKTNQWEGKWV